MNTFFYGALPYIAFTIFLVGTIARFAFFERGWTTKSSEFLEKKQVRFAVPIFHLGLVMALGGHLIGILVPKFVTEGAGVNEEMYHMIALSGGIPAGALFVLGLVLCIVRRFSSDRLVVNTSGMDKVLYTVLAFTILTGCWGTHSNIAGGFDYRESIAPWFRSLLMLSPDPSLMTAIPLPFQLHMCGWMLTAILFPFTRLVHCLSFPFVWLWRSRLVYRRRY